MKENFAQTADRQAADHQAADRDSGTVPPVRPVKVDNGCGHAFVFGSGPLTPAQVYFIASNTGISNDLEGPDYNTFSVMDQYLAARKTADKYGLPCVVVAVLDEARASFNPARIVSEIGTRTPANQSSLLQRGMQALRRAFT